MPHIFISYSKKDTRELAFELCDALSSIAGITAWTDRSLAAGRSWESEIQREIRRCDVFVVLYSPDINRHLDNPHESESYVLEELAYARYTLRKNVIPIMAQPTEPPMGMTRIHYIDFAAGTMTLSKLSKAILNEAGINVIRTNSHEYLQKSQSVPVPSKSNQSIHSTKPVFERRPTR